MPNINSLNTELLEEILWRYKELKNIGKLYNANINKKIVVIGGINKEIIENTKESRYILRSSFPLIYAHWEGFFKKSIELLHNKLDSLPIDYNKLDNTLLAILTKDKHTEKYKKINFKFSEILIDTESNLSWKVLEKFSLRYNFNINRLEKYKSEIEQLLKIRNGISHGENAYHFDNVSLIQKFINVTINLMIIIKSFVINFLTYRNYYKK